jgi:hypothetical protein
MFMILPRRLLMKPLMPLRSSKTAVQIISKAAGTMRRTAKPDHFMNRLLKIMGTVFAAPVARRNCSEKFQVSSSNQACCKPFHCSGRSARGMRGSSALAHLPAFNVNMGIEKKAIYVDRVI